MTAPHQAEGLATMDLTTATPAEIDAEICRLGIALAEQFHIMAQAKRYIEHRQDDPMAKHYYAEGLTKAHKAHAAAVLAANATRAERAPFTAEFTRRGGWTRYFLVDSSNGHVHRDDAHYRCSRTNSTTHAWLTDQSGRPAENVVHDAGERACTVCFPWAPVETLSRPSKFTPPCEVEKAAKRAEREAKAAAKRAKEFPSPLRIPDGVDGRYTETLKTVRSAEIKAVDLRFWAKCYKREMEAWEVKALDRILGALAAKRDTTVAAQRAIIDTKYVAKCKREGITP